VNLFTDCKHPEEECVCTWKKTFTEIKVGQHYLGKIRAFLEQGNSVSPAPGTIWSCRNSAVINHWLT